MTTAETHAIALLQRTLGGPHCEAEMQCVECNDHGPMRCGQPATARVSAECDTPACACRIVLLLCTAHADLAMTDWPNAVERRPL